MSDALTARAEAAKLTVLGDPAGAELCNEYADLVEALDTADTPEAKMAAADNLSRFRAHWRGIRDALAEPSQSITIAAPTVTGAATADTPAV